MKTTLIFLHGGPGFKDYLKPFFSGLTEKFNCIFYDQLQGAGVRVENLLSELDEIMMKIPGEKVLVGHSWGGILAIEYASLLPKSVSGLVLMNTGLNSKHWSEEYHQELKRLGMEEAPMEKIFLTDSELKTGLPFLMQVEKTFSEPTFESLNEGYLGHFDTTSRFKNLQMPILNIFSEKDLRFPAYIARTFKDSNPNVRDFEIKNAGHFPFLMEEGRWQIYQIIEDAFF